MPGGEYLTTAVLEGLYARMTSAVQEELAEWDGTVEAYLRSASPAWNLVGGRVCFHLAENKNDPEAPFAFVATYRPGCRRRRRRSTCRSRRRSGNTQVRATSQRCWRCWSPCSAPRGRARWRRIWSTAARVFQTLAWTPSEAHRFLRKSRGSKPRAWSCGCRRHGERSARRARKCRSPWARSQERGWGGRHPGFLDGGHARGRAAHRGRAACNPERHGGPGAGRGRWVEIDRERLRQVLDHWSAFEAAC